MAMSKTKGKEMKIRESKTLTTAFGIPVADDQNSLTAGERGPVFMQDIHLLEKLAHFDRERIPERVVHAKGAGAYGYFEVTADVTNTPRPSSSARWAKRLRSLLAFPPLGAKGVQPMRRGTHGVLP